MNNNNFFGSHTNRLPLYFTGTMTIIILLIGTFLLVQIVNIQNTHVEMEEKQDLLLQQLSANQKEILKNQELFKHLDSIINDTYNLVYNISQLSTQQ